MLRTLINVDPVHEVRSLEDVFERLFGQPARPVANTSTLPVDVIERDGKLLVKAAVPGIHPDNLEITIEKNVLSIRGETRHESQADNDKIYRREVSYGAFSRSIRLPEHLDLNGVSADFENGMVTISIPRQPEEKPQALRVPVKTVDTRPIASENTPTEGEPSSN